MSHFFGNPAQTTQNELAPLIATFYWNTRDMHVFHESINRTHMSSAILFYHIGAPRVSLRIELASDSPFIPAGTLSFECRSKYVRFWGIRKDRPHRLTVTRPYRTGRVLKSVHFPGPGAPSYADLLAVTWTIRSDWALGELRSDAAASYWSASTILKHLISVAAAHTIYCGMSPIKSLETMLAREICAADGSFPWATPMQLAVAVESMMTTVLDEAAHSRLRVEVRLWHSRDDGDHRQAADQEWDAARERWENAAEAPPARANDQTRK